MVTVPRIDKFILLKHLIARALLTIFCLLLPVLLLSARNYLPGPGPATVLRVIDGDSLVVRVTIWLGQEVETMVRLLGIDTPELRGKCSEERELVAHSRNLTSELAGQGSVISLTEIQLGKFAGRVLARVETSDGVDVGGALIEAGPDGHISAGGAIRGASGPGPMHRRHRRNRLPTQAKNGGSR